MGWTAGKDLRAVRACPCEHSCSLWRPAQRAQLAPAACAAAAAGAGTSECCRAPHCTILVMLTPLLLLQLLLLGPVTACLCIFLFVLLSLISDFCPELLPLLCKFCHDST